MKKTISIIAILLISFAAFSQNIEFSVSGGVNCPKIYPDYLAANYPIPNDIRENGIILDGSVGHFDENGNFVIDDNSGNISAFSIIAVSSKVKEVKFESKSGFTISANASFTLYKKLFMETGLQLSMIRYLKSEVLWSRNDMINSIGDNNNSWNSILNNLINNGYGGIYPRFGDIDDLPQNPDYGTTRILYTQIPIRLGYKLFNDRMRIKLGVIPTILTWSEYHNNRYLIGTKSEVVNNSDGFTNLMLSFDTEIEIRIWKNISSYINCSYFGPDIYDKNTFFGDENPYDPNLIHQQNFSSEKTKIGMVSLGVKYSFSR